MLSKGEGEQWREMERTTKKGRNKERERKSKIYCSERKGDYKRLIGNKSLLRA
jgi:hypothetical protein